MTRKQWLAYMAISLVAVFVALAVSCFADEEQDAEQALLDAGVARIVAEQEKIQAIERAEGTPLWQDSNYVLGDLELSRGIADQKIASDAFNEGVWRICIVYANQALSHFITSAGYFEQAFPPE